MPCAAATTASLAVYYATVVHALERERAFEQKGALVGPYEHNRSTFRRAWDGGRGSPRVRHTLDAAWGQPTSLGLLLSIFGNRVEVVRSEDSCAAVGRARG